MSGDELDITRLAIERLSCPRCGRGPTHRCVTKTGRLARYQHGDRAQPLYEAWRDGYREGWKTAVNAAVAGRPYWLEQMAKRREETKR